MVAALIAALFASPLAPLPIAAAPQTVLWDLSVELDAEGDPPDQVCLVTPVHPDRLSSRWFRGVPLERLLDRGVLVQGKDEPEITFERESALRSAWFETPMPEEQHPVRDAFDAMRTTPGDPTSCSTREPAGCEPSWAFAPPKLTRDWPWVVMCSPNHARGPDASVAFLTVRGVDLDLAYTPYVIAFDVFGGAVQIRFDSVRTKKELEAANFQASVGVLGGDFHPVAAAPSFRGRVSVPLRPRCRNQEFRLPENARPKEEATRTVILGDDASTGDKPCVAARFEAAANTCRLQPDELDNGVFSTRVPLGVRPRPNRIEVLVEPDEDVGEAPVCAATTWSEPAMPAAIDLQPTQIVLRWRWPCFAQTSEALECPVATVDPGGKTCQVTSGVGSNTCVYRCPATRGDQQSVGWPVSVRLDHAKLSMHWSYELDALSSAREGTFAPEDRRFMIRRGPRFPVDDSERWPAWWTQRRGDEIDGAYIFHRSEKIRIPTVGGRDPVVGAVTLPGPECREHVVFRYASSGSTSRRYNRRDMDVTWPLVEIAAPDRSAVPLLLSAEVGAAVVIDATDAVTAQPQLALGGSIMYRHFWKHDKDSERAAWLLGARYFAMFGNKKFIGATDTDIRAGAVQHGVAARYEMRFDRYHALQSRIGFAINAGAAWTTLLSPLVLEGEFGYDFHRPAAYLAPEALFHYAWFRASLSLALLGPSPSGDPAHEKLGGAEGQWFLVPTLVLAAEL